MRHNYQQKLDDLIAQGWLTLKPGTVSELLIRHDNDCPFLKGRTCKCEPDFELVSVDERGCGCTPEKFERRARSKKVHTEK